jgi:hypothetical protein
MILRTAALIAAFSLAACGGRPASSPAPTGGPAGAQSPTPTPVAALTPAPRGLDSPLGRITIDQPRAFARVQSPVAISGSAIAFEARFQWRIVDLAGNQIAADFANTSTGTGRGTFSVSAPFTVTADTQAYIEVVTRSARDGSVEDAARLPVTLTSSAAASPSAGLTPAPRAFDSPLTRITVDQPRGFARVTSPLTISGSAIAFEANVLWRVLDLSGREIATGFGQTSTGLGRGTYSLTATFQVPSETYGYVEVFTHSARDGSVEDAARVPVLLAPR